MTTVEKAKKILLEIDETTKLGDLRSRAKEIKKDHELAMELWNSNLLNTKLLAILIMDVKKLDSESIDTLLSDIEKLDNGDRLQLTDWLMANQLTKDKKNIELILSWQQHPFALKRRIFWYYQGRLRWTGQTPPNNTQELLDAIERNMLNETPETQWAMNFTAAWIGIFDKNYRKKCIEMGKELGLYKDEIVAKNCHPNYLPKFIETEVAKRKL